MGGGQVGAEIEAARKSREEGEESVIQGELSFLRMVLLGINKNFN